MKRIVIAILLLLSLNSSAQVDTLFYSNLTDLIEATIDTCTNNYIVGGVEFQKKDSNKCFIRMDLPRYYVISYPLIKTTKQFDEYYDIAMHYSNTNTYYAKVFAKDLFDYLLLMAHRKDYWKMSLPDDKKEEYSNFLVSRILDKSKMPYLEYSASSISELPKEYTSNKIIEEMKEVLRNPYYNDQQVTLFIDARKPKYDKRDTIKKVSINPNTGSYMKVSNWRKTAKVANQSLVVYLDSMQSLENIKFKNKLNSELINEVVDIIELTGKNYIIELAPDVENLIPRLDSVDAYKVMLVLARLQYKDYEEKMIEMISKKLECNLKDSLNINGFVTYKLRDCSRDLSYINTQNSYFAKSLLLLCKINTYTIFGYKNYNQIFLEDLHMEIKNLPIGFDEKYNPFYKENSMREKYDLLYEGTEAPDSFFNLIYNWMIENKGNYKLSDQ